MAASCSLDDPYKVLLRYTKYSGNVIKLEHDVFPAVDEVIEMAVEQFKIPGCDYFTSFQIFIHR